MKKNQIATIAENTNTSTATVSKVLNHRHGVSNDVRKMVFSEYDRIGGGKKEEPVSVYVIMPEIPRYFWGREYPELPDAGLRVKYNIYTRMGDDEMVLRYLHQAIALEAQVIVIAARLTDEMREILDAFSAHGLVIYLTEHNLTRGSIYVGSDPTDDGRQLAQLCRQHINESDRLLMILHEHGRWGETCGIRCDAFLAEMAGEVHCGACHVDFSADTSLLASLMAREMLPLLENGAYNKAICFCGYTHAVCLAVQKLHLPYTIRCFGFEDTPQNEKFADLGLLGGVVSQDFPAQMAAALSLAHAFVSTGQRPETERVIIPCKTLEYG